MNIEKNTRRIGIFLGMGISFLLGACQLPVAMMESASMPAHSTPARFVPPSSHALLEELRMLRINPVAYSQHLRAWLPYFQGNILALPNQVPKQTREGKRAVIEAIQVLDNQASLSTLTVSNGLSKAASDHVNDQAQTGAVGHSGADGSHIWDRADRYGKWNIEVGEAIAYGRNDARSFILQLLVDDGVPDRGHRKALLDARWKKVGASVGTHPVYTSMCVLTFAIQYTER